MNKHLKCLLLVLVALTIGVIAGCEKKGPMQTAGENVDDAVERTGEAVDDAVHRERR